MDDTVHYLHLLKEAHLKEIKIRLVTYNKESKLTKLIRCVPNSFSSSISIAKTSFKSFFNASEIILTEGCRARGSRVN